MFFCLDAWRVEDQAVDARSSLQPCFLVPPSALGFAAVAGRYPRRWGVFMVAFLTSDVFDADNLHA